MGKTRMHTCRTCGIEYPIPADLLGSPGHGDRCLQALVRQVKGLQDVVDDLRKRFEGDGK